MNCVVSSLVQVMCDPHCRSVAGFQSLVQKEWVTAGHRFLSRINYHRDSDKEEVTVQIWASSLPPEPPPPFINQLIIQSMK